MPRTAVRRDCAGGAGGYPAGTLPRAVIAPSLTVCIPTHDGRADVLAELLGDLAAQRHPAVDVVVCDNASADHTAAVVARAQADGLPLTYVRQRENLGAARNIAATVAHAAGTFCWLVSSDDRVPPGAIARVLDLLGEHPDAVGMTVHQAVLDVHMAWVAEAQATAAVPALGRVTRLHGAPEVVGALGWIMSGLSSQVVRRDDWLAAANVVAAGQLYPHVAVMLAMAAGGRPWVWCPEKLVHVRAGNASLPVSGERWESLLITELDRHWRAAAGGGSGGRAALRTVHERYLAAAVRRARQPRSPADAPSRADDLALLRAIGRAVWARPGFWLRVAPRLTVRALDRRTPPEPLPMGALAPGERGARVAAALPTVMDHADEAWVEVTVTNGGPATWTSAGPHPVHLGSRWRPVASPAWHGGGRVRLMRPLAPGAARTIPVLVVAPLAPGDWELQLTLVQEGVAWFADDDPGAAAVARVRVRAPAPAPPPGGC